MKQKLTSNQAKFQEFKEGLADNINKSLNLISKSRVITERPNSPFGKKRNFLEEFNKPATLRSYMGIKASSGMRFKTSCLNYKSASFKCKQIWSTLTLNLLNTAHIS